MSKGQQVEVPLRWSDMDAYGHVNNVQFLRLLEDARVMGFQQWFGQDRSVLAEGIVVSRHEIEYLAPLTYRPAPVAVKIWVTAIGVAGFDVAYEVCDSAQEGATIYARAHTGLILYDFTAARLRRLDGALRESLQQFQAPPIDFRWRTA